MKKTPLAIVLTIIAATFFFALRSVFTRGDREESLPAPEQTEQAEAESEAESADVYFSSAEDTSKRVSVIADSLTPEEAPSALAAPERKTGEPHNAPEIPHSFPSRPAPQMGWARAQYVIDGMEIRPGNNAGRMSMVKVEPLKHIFVSMHWPGAVQGAAVAVEVVDGGRIDDQEVSKLLRVSENGNIDFTFVANDMPGRCQVVVRHGMDETALTFWVASGQPENEPPTL